MQKGTYILLLKLEKDQQIQVGKLGPFLLEKGFYCYVGSAMNGLDSRINRHLVKEKKLHWHIDYFTQYADIFQVITIPGEKRMECALSKRIDEIADDKPVKKFGSSDCRCESHLFYFEKNPEGKLREMTSPDDISRCV